MILLTRLNGPQIAVNADLIERAEATPDTVLTLVDGTKYLVAESVQDVIDRVRVFRASVLVAAKELEDSASQPRATLRGVLPPTPERADMDPASFVGIGIALFALFVAMIMDGGSPTALLAPSSMLLTFGGTIGAATAGMLMSDAKQLPTILKTALTTKVTAPDESVAVVVSFAEKARRQGLLALEEEARQIDDSFLRKGIEMAVDGVDPEEIRDIMEQDLEAMKARHRAGAQFFQNMGGFAPTMGIIGTVMGLLHVLQNLSTPATLGPMIAAAFTATLWGVMQANVFWIPISNRLKRTSEIEVRRMELLLEGILAIQAGANPRVVEQRLLSYLSPKEQEAAKSAKDTGKSKAAA